MIDRRALKALTAAALLVTVAFAPGRGWADPSADPGDGGVDGVYELKEVAAAGVYSGADEADARNLVGRSLTLHGAHIVAPTAALCHIVSSRRTLLRDGFESFGTAGGSWSQVGLTKTSAAGYEVTEIETDCAGPFHRILLQPASQTYLLAYWSVFLVMARE